MRQIKVRAWDTKHNKMWSPEEMGSDQLTLSPDGRGFVNVSSRSVHESKYYAFMIPEEFTGLLDKNGKEIYEGDILRLDYETVTMTGKVQQRASGEWEFYKDEQNFLQVFHNLGRIEIIGNVHENGEKLKNE